MRANIKPEIPVVCNKRGGGVCGCRKWTPFLLRAGRGPSDQFTVVVDCVLPFCANRTRLFGAVLESGAVEEFEEIPLGEGGKFLGASGGEGVGCACYDKLTLCIFVL